MLPQKTAATISFRSFQVNELSNNSIKLSDNLCRLVNVSQEFHVCDKQSNEQQDIVDPKWTKQKVMNEFRKFNIDVTPKVFYVVGCNLCHCSH